TSPGFGPNTRTLMKITVTGGACDGVTSSAWLASLNAQLKSNFLSGNQPCLLYNNCDPSVPGPVPYKGPIDRSLTVNEDFDEYGRKETVRMNPGDATTVITKFILPNLPASLGDPVSPRTGGHEYVWHCHILEHEEHDMMRPLVVR